MTPRLLRQPLAAVMDLCDGFFDDLSFLSSCPRLAPEALPPAARRLLVHREHMTAALGTHFGRPVNLRVLEEQSDDGLYGRKILLTLPESGAVVEFGIVRMDFSKMSDAVRDEIVHQQVPLGDILLRHNVLRRISPRWYFAFPPQTPIARAFGEPARTGYGRVGTIYCDEEPAIEVLEVVAGTTEIGNEVDGIIQRVLDKNVELYDRLGNVK